MADIDSLPIVKTYVKINPNGEASISIIPTPVRLAVSASLLFQYDGADHELKRHIFSYIAPKATGMLP